MRTGGSRQHTKHGPLSFLNGGGPPPPRPRDLPTGEIIQWTGFSGPETSDHLTP